MNRSPKNFPPKFYIHFLFPYAYYMFCLLPLAVITLTAKLCNKNHVIKMIVSEEACNNITLEIVAVIDFSV
jgi:hypothetical protein